MEIITESLLKCITVAIVNPGDKVLKLLVVLDDRCDGVAFPLEVEGVDTNIIVRKPLHKV